MADRGLTTALLAADRDTTTDTKTLPEESWSSIGGTKYKERVWEGLRNRFQQDELTDVMLAAEGQLIPCHKVLLAAASTFFRDKLVVHPESLDHNLLDIEGIEFDTLTAIVSFMYNEPIELTVQKTEKMIPASVNLTVPELTNMCKNFLLHKVEHDISACIDIHNIAKSNSLTEIATRAWQVVVANFQELSKLTAFKEMSETDLQDYIRDEGLNVANENPVFEAVVTWVKHDIKNRKSHFENLMENIKLSHCSAEFLGEVVRKEPLMETLKCLQHLSEALYLHGTSLQQSGTPRKGSNIMATGRLNTTLPAAGGDATTGNKASPKELWSTTTTCEKYKARVWEDLRNMFQQDELTDVMLAAEGQSIPCHRVLLAAASTFFHDKFVVHPESLEHNLLDIKGIDFDTLTAIVSFAYNAHVKLTFDKMEKLLAASVRLMLPELTNMCKNFLLHKVKHDTSACIDIHGIAKSYSLTEVVDQSWQVMLENFSEVSKGNAFRDMSMTDLQDYISDEQLNVANENPVFEAVLSWVKHDVKNRKSTFETMMENVKLAHCSLEFLGEVVRKEPLMKTGSCLEHLSDAMYHQATRYPQQTGTARSGYYKIYGHDNQLITVYEDNSYTLKTTGSEWVENKFADGKRLDRSSACMSKDGIFITGGLIGSNLNSTQCWKLSLPTMNWTALPDLNLARRDHATVFLENKIYVLGGFHTETLQSVEYLGEQKESWQVGCDMPFQLFDHTAVSYRQMIYVFGGYHGYSSRYSQATFILNTVNKEWSRRANMPSTCFRGCSVVYRDRIYILGGYENCCMSYDPDQDQWKSHSKPAVEHVRPSAVVWKDRILLCGGENTSVIEKYNPDTDTWCQYKSELPKAAKIPPVVFASHV